MASIDKPFDARLATLGEMAPVGAMATLALGLCLVLTRVLLPRLCPKAMGALSPARQFFVAQCVVSGLHALVSGPVSTYVMYQLLFFTPPLYGDCPSQPNAATVVAPPLAVWVCGFTCGYFVYDALVMFIFSAFCEEEMGKSGTILMWGHHIISLFVWPYCVASDRAVIFVVACLVTELTNIGQAVFLVMNKGKLGGGGALESIVGGTWALSFFVCRIVSIPWLLYTFYDAILLSHCGMGIFDRALGFLTVPLPVLLNIYWFGLISRKAARMLGGSKPEKKQKQKK